MNLIQIDMQTTITRILYYETRILQSVKVRNRLTSLAHHPQHWEHAQALREAIAAAQTTVSEAVDFDVRVFPVTVATGDQCDTVYVLCGITERLRGIGTKRAYACGYLVTVYADELQDAAKTVFGKAIVRGL